jgi:hypothetical protein
MQPIQTQLISLIKNLNTLRNNCIDSAVQQQIQNAIDKLVPQEQKIIQTQLDATTAAYTTASNSLTQAATSAQNAIKDINQTAAAINSAVQAAKYVDAALNLAANAAKAGGL